MTALLTADEAARLTLGVNVIVRPGDRTEDFLDRCWDYSPPKAWVALTGPCPTCEGIGIHHWPMTRLEGGGTNARCEWCDFDIEPVRDGWDHVYRNDPRGRSIEPTHVPTPARCPNPDCRDGRRIVPLYAETCSTTWGANHRCALAPGHDGPHMPAVDGLNRQGVLVARGSIEVVPVVTHGVEIPVAWMPHIGPDQHGQWFIWHGPNIDQGENPTTGRYDWKRTPIPTLGPLPVPGRDWGILIDCVEVNNARTEGGTEGGTEPLRGG